MASLRTAYVYSALIGAAIDLVSVAIVYVAAKDRRVSFPYILLAVTMAMWCAGIGLQSLPEVRTSAPLFVDSLRFGLMVFPATALHLAWAWSGMNPTRRGIVLAAYGFAALLCALCAGGWMIRHPAEYPWGAFRELGEFFLLHPLMALCCAVTGAVWCIGTLRSDSASPSEKLRSKYWLLGGVVFLLAAIPNYLFAFGVSVVPTGPIGNILLLSLWAYATVRHRLIDLNVIVVRSATAVLSGASVALPIAAAIVWYHHLDLGLGSALIFLPIAVSAVVAIVLFARVSASFQEAVEDSLFPMRKSSRHAVERLGQDFIGASGYAQIAQRLTITICQALEISAAGLYRLSDRADYILDHGEGSARFPKRVSLIAAREMIGHEVGGWGMLVPVLLAGEQIGFIAVGSRPSGAEVDESDRVLLALIAAQLAITWRSIALLNQIEDQKLEINLLQKRVEAENVILRSEVATSSQFKEIIGASPELHKMLGEVGQIAPTDVTVLVTGETGTGKELIARAIHHLSPRVHGPWVCVNSPAIPLDLAESELFGHERGAFTGAVDARPGKFEMAHNGTLFLDEIADLPMALQVKLLRVIQEHEVQRLGGQKTLKLNLRIVAATNRDLREAVAAGEFREDLYFRLSAVNIHVPALRHRPSDVPILASYFLQRAASAYQKEVAGFAPEAMSVLQNYHWPGNIRELQHVIERATLLCTGDRIRAEHLGDLAVTAVVPQRASLNASMNMEKRRRVESTLVQTGGNQAAAARLLGMSRSNLGRLMKSLGLKDPTGMQ